ncbi:MAG: KH domain-containing protein [Bacilli bacterium]|nr:KH domain-containing protein [Bacilli bacterium]
MIDYEKTIHALIDPLVEHPESIMIREMPGSTDRDVTLLIVSEDDDTARLIGKRGAVANALREAVGVIGKADNSNVRIHLKFESFNEDEGSDAE